MRYVLRPIPLLVLLTIVIDAILLVWWEFGRTRFSPRIAQVGTSLLISFLYNQVALLTLWIGFGRSSFWVRWLIPTVAFCLALGSLGSLSDYQKFYVLTFLASAGTLALVVLLLRWLGVVIEDRSRSKVGLQSPPPAFQFSIRQVLFWVTFLSLILGLLKVTEYSPSTGQVWYSILHSIFSTYTILSACWLALGQRFLRLRIFLLMVGALVGLAVNFLTLMRVASYESWHKVYLYVLFIDLIDAASLAILCLLYLLVVRRCGYRLVRYRRGQVPPVEVAPANSATPSHDEVSPPV